MRQLYYTPELKLQLIRLCINERTTVLFQETVGNQAKDVRRKVINDRKKILEVQKKSGVAEAPTTDFDHVDGYNGPSNG